MAILKSVLNPSETVAIGVGIGAVDAFIFAQHLPPVADIRTANPQNDDVDAARRQATGLCIAVNGFVSLITRDWNVFLIGGIVTVGMSYITAHANSVNPATGKMDGSAPSIAPEGQAYPLPDYSEDTETDYQAA
jgi:hypothetical protein